LVSQYIKFKGEVVLSDIFSRYSAVACVLCISALNLAVTDIQTYAAEPATNTSSAVPNLIGSENLQILAQSNPRIDKEFGGGFNTIDNPEQIDRPDELEEASKNPHTNSSDDLSRELSNPNTPLAKLTVKSTTTLYEGNLPSADEQIGNVILFQPVFPFPLTDDGTRNLFIRPAFSFLTPQPLFNAGKGEFESKVRFGDMGFDVALGQSFDNGVVAVGGMQGTIPTGGRGVTGDQFRLGPEAVLAYIKKEGALGAFPAHQWDVAGGGSTYSTSTLELFVFKFIEGGWTFGTNPVLSYDWENEEATIPINLTLRNVMKIGNVPMQISGQFDYFVDNNDVFGQEMAFTINLTPIVPNFIYNALK
jgi:hypothetical protein